MTVKNIFDYLNLKFPVTDAMDFDNVGILVGDAGADAQNALICLDCTFEAISVAAENKCNLIITHHPVIFDPLKTLLKGSVQYELVKNNLSVISVHTNLDVGVGGVNDCLCDTLGIENSQNITASDGYSIKLGSVSPISPKAFAQAIKSKLGGFVKYVEGSRPISKVLVCSGSGGNYIEDAVSLGADALITSDIKHHHFLTAQDNGISLFDAGHFNTEDIVIDPLKKLLENEFSDVRFISFHSQSIKYE